MFKQANWNEKLIFDLGKKGRRGHFPPKAHQKIRRAIGEIDDLIPGNMRRTGRLELPELSEVEVVRHYTRL
ncbi:aminomethyl-transferring glycine dehydrogenase subunit GcvPB, partial [Candidatus Bathyarchaeota archaeon]|nr:aminomethyl-transferring glycine dehydrogenase subunit GcvPB [Candidatus Bathyarchaeota archaeon]